MRKVAKITRYIAPETVCIADVIRVTWKYKDTEHSIVGTVNNRQVFTHSTEYLTAEGEVLLTHWRYNPPYKIVVTLLDRPSERVTLPGMENFG